MNIQDIVRDIKKNYYEEIKPLILGKNPRAKFEMGNLVFVLEHGEFGNTISRYHSGISFIASASILYEELKRDKYPERTEMFEAYLSQLELSIKTVVNKKPIFERKLPQAVFYLHFYLKILNLSILSPPTLCFASKI